MGLQATAPSRGGTALFVPILAGVAGRSSSVRPPGCPSSAASFGLVSFAAGLSRCIVGLPRYGCRSYALGFRSR